MKENKYRVVETRKIIHYPRSMDGAFGTLCRLIDNATAEGFKFKDTVSGEYLFEKEDNGCLVQSIIIKIEKEQESQWNS